MLPGIVGIGGRAGAAAATGIEVDAVKEFEEEGNISDGGHWVTQGRISSGSETDDLLLIISSAHGESGGPVIDDAHTPSGWTKLFNYTTTVGGGDTLQIRGIYKIATVDSPGQIIVPMRITPDATSVNDFHHMGFTIKNADGAAPFGSVSSLSDTGNFPDTPDPSVTVGNRLIIVAYVQSSVQITGQADPPISGESGWSFETLGDSTPKIQSTAAYKVDEVSAGTYSIGVWNTSYTGIGTTLSVAFEVKEA